MKATLQGYLRVQRDAALWRVEGVSERDLPDDEVVDGVRRTPPRPWGGEAALGV